MPTNLYGDNDNFDPMTSHVLPGMITKFHNAKVKNENIVTLWGDGTPLREFLHVEDLANAIHFCINNNLQENLYNVGSEDEVSIKQLAEIVKDVIGYQGKIVWDSTYPNGTPRKKLDSSRFKSLGWEPKVKLDEGITKTYHSYLSKINE
jgi:GDP-L-fucose synthase